MNQELYEKLINDGILRKHNLKAYIKVVKEFEKSNRVGIVHATGTGKSFIALQLMYDNSDKKIKYLVPRTGIGDQIEEHINGLSENAREEYFKNVDILTYQKLINLTKEEIENLDIDYLIMDEFHHIGAPMWKNAIDLLIETHPNLKIFGMTATPVRSRGTSKQEDIGDTFFDGNIASTYTLAQAIADGVLMPPIYKGAVYMLEERLNETQEKINQSNLSEEEKKEYLERIENAKKQVSNADSFSKMIRKNIKSNGKYIVFCPRGKREEYQLESEQWFEGLIDEKNITRYFVDSKHPKQSQINSDEFYNDHDTSKLKLMFAMDMYTEGIHVPDIDGIIMMRQTKSDIMFYQMLGRALASNKGKQTLVLDFVNNYEYIMKLKDYTKKEIEARENNREYTSERELKDIFEQFDIKLENISILNMLEEINKKVDLSFEQKIEEYIELLNQGYIPKAKEKIIKFSNGNLINLFWSLNKIKIKEKLYNDKKYDKGYDLAKQICVGRLIDKKVEFIELLNQGYIPKFNDEETEFYNGEKIKRFWSSNKEKIKELLNTDLKYKIGYETARESIEKSKFDKIEEFIELLNNGYKPISDDKITKFSNGEIIRTFWSRHKNEIKERIKTNSKYDKGYDTVHRILDNLSFDKIEEFIELLNQGYVPKSLDEKTKFSNGESINSFWTRYSKQVIERLNTDSTYEVGYDLAKRILTCDKVADYIELLNQGYKPTRTDTQTKFSNGEPINTFWRYNFDKIIERLKTDPKYKTGYETVHQFIENLSFDKIADYIELLNKGYRPISHEKKVTFSNGEMINSFWTNNSTKIIERLKTDSKYKTGYELANKMIESISFDKIADYIELLNKSYIPIPYDPETTFSNGEPINYFWQANKEKIIERLNTDEKYKNKYTTAKESLTKKRQKEKKTFDKIADFIELLNQGYKPKKNDPDRVFSNGDAVNYFWQRNKSEVIKRLNDDSKYKNGYEVAHKVIKDLSLDKIADYIELLNKGYKPISNEKKVTFSNGDLLNKFWVHYKDNIIERLQTDIKYKQGYEVAHATISRISVDKMSEYIELLNQGHIPKDRDNDTKFSNGDQVNNFWPNHKEQIKEKIDKNPKYQTGYDLAKKIVEVMTIPKEERKEKLIELKEYINNMNQDNMSSGGIKR